MAMRNVMELDNGLGRCVRDHKISMKKKKKKARTIELKLDM